MCVFIKQEIDETKFQKRFGFNLKWLELEIPFDSIIFKE